MLKLAWKSLQCLQCRFLTCLIGSQHYDMATKESILCIKSSKLGRRFLCLKVGHKSSCMVRKSGSNNLLYLPLKGSNKV